jgi:hypothetical protein
MYHCHSLITPASAYLAPLFFVSYTIRKCILHPSSPSPSLLIIHFSAISHLRLICRFHPIVVSAHISSPPALQPRFEIQPCETHFRLASLLPHQYLLDLLTYPPSYSLSESLHLFGQHSARPNPLSLSVSRPAFRNGRPTLISLTIATIAILPRRTINICLSVIFIYVPASGICEPGPSAQPATDADTKRGR